eukprot:g4337.t1
MHSTSSCNAPWKLTASIRPIHSASRTRHCITVSEPRKSSVRRRSSRKPKLAGRICSLRSSEFIPSQNLHRWCGEPRPMLLFRFKRRSSSFVISATMVSSQDSQSFLEKELPFHSDLVLGELENGMRYVIFPNKTPPNRFEAHLEVHAGSVDERTDQQGLAHLVEHVTFLGSPKRESLLGTGSRSNAYTDFHHTVFHVHCPLVNEATKKPMMPQVLDALRDVVFNPQFASSRIEKERRAVLSEAQMMNTIQYRVDCQMLKYLHEENALGCRFPIGKTEQIRKWDRDMIREFWSKWYYPANMTLYIVGVLPEGVDATKELIRATFGDVQVNMFQENNNGDSRSPTRKLAQTIRPPVEHLWGVGEFDDAFPCGINIFRHPLLQQFTLSIYCKIPVKPIKTFADLKYCLMVRVLMSVFAHRINARYSEQNPPFVAVEMDISDSAREGCQVGTIAITSEPKDWRGALEVAVQETRRLQRHGLKKAELQQFMGALLKDTELSAEAMDSITSVDNLDYLMESLALDHKVVHPKLHQAAIVDCGQNVTLDEMKALARSLLSFGSDYGREKEIIEEYKQSKKGEWWEIGPTFATSIVACVPAFVDASGVSRGGRMAISRGQSMMTVDHVVVDSSSEELNALVDEDEGDFEVPEGAVRFEITEDGIREVLTNQDLEVEAGPDIEVPEILITKDELDEKINTLAPKFVPLAEGSASDPTFFTDTHTGVVFRRLSNGIRLNFYSTDSEPKMMCIRAVFPGGRVHEKVEIGPSGFGSVRIGAAGLSESGTVKDWNRSQIELYCIQNLVNCQIDSTEEFMAINISLPSTDQAPIVALELVHLILEGPKWDPSAVDVAKQGAISDYRMKEKSLEDQSLNLVASVILGDDHRLLEPAPNEIKALEFEEVRKIITEIMNPSNMEVTFVGDFDLNRLQDEALKYLGTIQAKSSTEDYLKNEMRVVFDKDPGNKRHQVWHLPDSDERACGYIVGPAPARWGPFGSQDETLVKPKKIVPPVSDPEGRDANPLGIAFATAIRRVHPLYPSTTLALLKEIINSRLFTTVRDQLGLTYDVTFDIVQLERYPTAWFTVLLTSSPDKIHETVKASLKVLQRMKKQKVSMHELLRAKRTILTRHESELQKNEYWLGLLTHLQCDQVPMKTVETLRDFKAMLTSISLADLNDAYCQFDFSTSGVYTCIGTSGKTAPEARSIEEEMTKEESGNGSLAAKLRNVRDPTLLLKSLASAMAQKSGNE